MGLKEIGHHLKRYILLAKSLMKDRKTPFASKLLFAMAIGYLAMPFDLIPDFIPVLGQLDDAIIVPGLLFLAIKLIPQKLYRKHYSQAFSSKTNIRPQ